MIRRWLVLLLSLIALAGGIIPAGAFEQHIQSSHYNEEERLQLQDLFNHAEAEHLPVELLDQKLQEGLAKHVRFEPMQEALSNEIQAYTDTKALMIRELGEVQAQALLDDYAIWSRVSLLYQQGIDEHDLIQLVQIFERQETKDKWNNFRYGGGLLIALRQWGLNDQSSLSVIEALARSTIPGHDYQAILDIYNKGIAQRISPDDMSERIIMYAPKSRSISILERSVR